MSELPPRVDLKPADPIFAFHMRVVEKDRSGYYYVDWTRATPLVVHAKNRAAAFQKCWQVMGDCPSGRGWTWTAEIDKITEVSEAER